MADFGCPREECVFHKRRHLYIAGPRHALELLASAIRIMHMHEYVSAIDVRNGLVPEGEVFGVDDDKRPCVSVELLCPVHIRPAGVTVGKYCCPAERVVPATEVDDCSLRWNALEL